MCQAAKELESMREKLLEIGTEILPRDDDPGDLTNDELLAKIMSHVKQRGEPVMSLYMKSLKIRRHYERVVETVRTIEAGIDEGATLIDLTPARIELNARLAELPPSLVLDGSELIVHERYRQTHAQGWTSEHDDEHACAQLATAAMCYAMLPALRLSIGGVEELWPFEADAWKPSPENRVRELTIAGAFAAAEIDRLLRLKGKEGQANG